MSDNYLLKYDLHVHTKYSYDSMMDPGKIIKFAKKKNLDGIAITDHNTINGSIAVQKENKDEDFHVIKGSEIKTEFGDIIGLFLNEEIYSRRFEEVIDGIRDQNGLVILPHPYRHFKCPEKIINHVNVIETLNSRSKPVYNQKSVELARKFNFPCCAGSDSHIYHEIGKVSTNVNEKLKPSANCFYKSKLKGKESNYYVSHIISIAIENLKRI